MRDVIRRRLAENADEALHSIGVAVNQTRLKLDPNNSRTYLFINKDYEDGFAKYMDRSVEFVSHVGRGSKTEYANELREAGNKLKEEIMAKIGHQNRKLGAFPGNSTRVALMGQLGPALDKLIKRKVEDFEFGFPEGKDMSATTQTVNIIGSTISNSVVQITQSGKDAISKETALKLQELVKSDAIKALPEKDQLQVLDRVSDLLRELEASTTDKGKVHRGLKRLGDFLSQVASSSIAETIAQAAIAYGTFYGLLPT
jgi:hypothetical protein